MCAHSHRATEQFLEAATLARLSAVVQQGLFTPLPYFNNKPKSIKNSAVPCESVAALPQR